MIQVLFMNALSENVANAIEAEENRRINAIARSKARELATVAANTYCPNDHPPKAFTIHIWPTADGGYQIEAPLCCCDDLLDALVRVSEGQVAVS
jgi:hypothetical protein